MPDDVTVIVEGGESESYSAIPESSAAETVTPSDVAEAAQTAEVVAGQAEDAAQFALVAANEALDRTDETLAEIEELRKEQRDEWRESVLTSLAELNQKLDSLMTPPAPPTETEAETELEIVNPPADETPAKKTKGRKRTLGLW